MVTPLASCGHKIIIHDHEMLSDLEILIHSHRIYIFFKKERCLLSGFVQMICLN